VTTFGRGGSDSSAAVIAYLLHAPEVEIWKDVDGFLSADPRIVPGAVDLATLSYDEAAELAYFGAKVLHPRAIQPARQAGIRIAVRNFLAPAKAGSVIQENGHARAGGLKSVSVLRPLSTIKVSGSGAGQRAGVLADIAEALSRAGVNVYSATTSQTTVALLLAREDLDEAQRALAEVTGGVLESVAVEEDVALICAVGEGLSRTPGVAAKVLRAVAEAGVNVHLISAGASSVACHFAVGSANVEDAVRAIHAAFFGGNA
jgi:aspartate kinase